MNKLVCLDENYSTTKMLYKLVNDNCLYKNGTIKEECKWNINNSEFNIKNSKLIGKPDDKFETVLFLPECKGRKGEGGLRKKGYFKLSYENLMMNDECLILKDKEGNQYKSNNSKFKIQNSKLDKLPLISIITVVFNGEKYLEETIQSVVNQTYDNVEYIIIDGGSTDGTLDIIKKYEDKIDYWVSEKDKGIGDAWNKGLELANGIIIGLINAGDLYRKDTVELIVANFNDEKTLYYGICKFIKNDEIIGVNNNKFNSNNLLWGFGFTHTTCFVPMSIYKNIGYFNVDIKIAVDTEFLLRCYMNNINFRKVNITIYMRTGGVSDTKNIEGYFEYLNVLLQNNIYSKAKIIKQKMKYKFYSLLIRFFVKSMFVRNVLRQAKHFFIKIFNVLYNNLPFFCVKKIFLKLFGITIGNHSYIHTKVRLYNTNKLIIGNYSVINSGCYLDNRSKITIGSNVSIAHDTKIYTCGHDIDSPFFDIKCQEVIIEDYVCIFSNVLIMPGVVIGEGAVILPGSVVTKNVGQYDVVGGNPAKKIKKRSKLLKYKINYGYWWAM